MGTSLSLQENEKLYLKQLKQYADKLKKNSNEADDHVREEARRALMRTGVMSKNGRLKKKIIKWE